MSNIRVLIVEDSGVVAQILKETLESDQRIEVVGVAANGQDAIELMPRLLPDLVTMDVWMPVLDGFATVEWIMANQPTPILVITSSKLKQDVQISLRMLAAGALDVIEKPPLNDEGLWQRQQAELLAKVKLLAGIKVITHVKGKLHTTVPAKPAPPPQPPKATPPPGKPIVSPAAPAPFGTSHPPAPAPDPYFFPPQPHYQIIAIASSTGGPTALLRILQKLPARLPCGLVVVQHISEGFTQGLVDWLQREVALKIRIAHQGDTALPGEVLVAPDRCDIIVRNDLKLATVKDETNLLRPNADVMMESVARVFGRRAIGVVLTGMGSDGARGLKQMYEAGAYTIAQDEASSLIYGMPRAALEEGGVREVLALDHIAGRIIELMRQPAQLESKPGLNRGSSAV